MKSVSALMLAATMISATTAQAAAPDLARVRALISDPKGQGAPGCAAGAFKDGKPLFVTAAGSGDIATGRALDGDTLFYAASVSKQFTALAAAKLVEAGKLSFDDDIHKYLPELPQYERPITVRMLMQHTSGVRDFLELFRLAGVENAATVKKNDAVALLAQQKDLNFTPGSAYTYSNGGYLLLAEIVERVSGEPFADYARETILAPLGMTRSGFMNDGRLKADNIAHGYVPVGESFEIRDTYPAFSGSGGLMVTVNDLGRYEHDVAVGHKVFTPAVAKMLTTPGVLNDGKPVSEPRMGGAAYGGGLMIGPRRGQFFITHGGGAEAFRTMYSRLPERKTAYVVLCNRGDWDSQAKADQLIEIVEGPILAAEPAKPAFDGRFVSDDLKATWQVAIKGDELNAEISSPLAHGAGKPLTFKRDGDGWKNEIGQRLTFDTDGQGFRVDGGRAKGLEFRRAG